MLCKYIILIEKQNILALLGNRLCHGLKGNTKSEGLPSSPYIDYLTSLKLIGVCHLLKLDFGFRSSVFSVLSCVRAAVPSLAIFGSKDGPERHLLPSLPKCAE